MRGNEGEEEGGKEGRKTERRKGEKLKSSERKGKEGTFYKDLQNSCKKIRVLIG